MKNEIYLHEAIRNLEREHNCIIYGVLDMESCEEDIKLCHDDIVPNLKKVSLSEFKDAMEYACDKQADSFAEEYRLLVELVAEYLKQTKKPNPFNHLGGYSPATTHEK